MNFNHYQSLNQATQELNERGFSHKFTFNGQELLSAATHQTYEASELAIIEYHRFAAKSDPEDHAVIFAIETNDDTKGTVILNYSSDENLELISFIDKVKVKITPEDD